MKNPKVNKCLSRKNHPKNILTKNIKKTSRKNIKKTLRNKKKSLKYQHLNINKIASKKKLGGANNNFDPFEVIEQEKEIIKLVQKLIQEAFRGASRFRLEKATQELTDLIKKLNVPEGLKDNHGLMIIHRILGPFYSSFDITDLLKKTPNCHQIDFNNLDLENGYKYINKLLKNIYKIYKDKSLNLNYVIITGTELRTPLHYFIESIAIIKHCLFKKNLEESINKKILLEAYYPPDGESMPDQLSYGLDNFFTLKNNFTSDGLLNLLKSLEPKDVLKITKEECEKLINEEEEKFKRLYPGNIIEEIYKEIKGTFKDSPWIRNVKTENGLTPLALACILGVHEMVELLLFPGGSLDEQVGVTVNTTTVVGSPLRFACGTGHAKVVEILLKYPNIDVNIENNGRDAPLSGACHQGHFEVVKLLLNHTRIDVNIKDESGDTPLIIACQNGYHKVVDLLLEHSTIDVNIQNEDGDTPLSIACSNGHPKVVELLLKQLNINVNNNEGSPLLAACQGRHIEVVKLLLKDPKIDVIKVLAIACDTGDPKVVELLLNHSKIDVNTKDEYGDAPLSIACSNGHPKVVELLLKQLNINVNIENIFDWNTPLIIACYNGYPEVVELLLEHPNINVNIQNIAGDTPLLLACDDGYLEVVELLLKHPKIDKDLTNKNGDTPLRIVYNRMLARYESGLTEKETLKLIYQTLLIEKNHRSLKSIFSETPLTYENMDVLLSGKKEPLQQFLRDLFKSNIKNNVGEEHRKHPSFFILDLNVEYEEDTCFKKLKDYLTRFPNSNSVIQKKIGITSYNEGSGIEKEDTFYHDFPGNESSDYGGLTKHFLNCLRENIINILQRDIKDPDCLWVLSHFKEIIEFYKINDFNFYFNTQEFGNIFGKGIIENTLAFLLLDGNPVGVCILQAYLSNNFEIPESVKATYPDVDDDNTEKGTCQQKTNQETYSEYNTYLEDNGLNKFKQLCANLFNNTNLLTEILFFLNKHLIDYTLEDMKSLIDEIAVDDIDNLVKFKELLKFSSTDMNEEQQMAIYKKLFLFWTAEEFPSGKLTLEFVDGDTSLNSHTCFNQLIISKKYLENFKTENLKIQELI